MTRPIIDPPKRWAFCPYCSSSYPTGTRHTCTPVVFMRWTGIVNALAGTLITIIVIVLLLILAGVWGWWPA